MSLHDYKKSIEIANNSYPFYALIMAAIRQADTNNFNILINAFPNVFSEFDLRYKAPGGVLDTDYEYIKGWTIKGENV